MTIRTIGVAEWRAKGCTRRTRQRTTGKRRAPLTPCVRTTATSRSRCSSIVTSPRAIAALPSSKARCASDHNSSNASGCSMISPRCGTRSANQLDGADQSFVAASSRHGGVAPASIAWNVKTAAAPRRRSRPRSRPPGQRRRAALSVVPPRPDARSRTPTRCRLRRDDRSSRTPHRATEGAIRRSGARSRPRGRPTPPLASASAASAKGRALIPDGRRRRPSRAAGPPGRRVERTAAPERR